MITSSLMDAHGIRHGFFTREGGVSEDHYASLNCSPYSHDDPDLVIENRGIAANALGMNGDQLCTTKQEHGSTVVFVTRAWRSGQAPAADGMVTNRQGLMLGILTADCVPVLLADPAAGVIGAAHAGWRGLASGVVAEVLRAMIEIGASPSRIRAVIGPAIEQRSYEVGSELRDRFLESEPDDYKFFAPGVDDESFYFDLKGCAAERLVACGVEEIELIGVDTYDAEDRFYSFRRATHRGEPDYGRQLSAILLERA